MTVYREILFFLVNLCFLYMPVTERCIYSSSYEVNICSAGSASGKRVGIRNSDVPNDAIVNCSCDIQSQGPVNIDVLFDGPGHDNCGTRLYLQNVVFSCHSGPTTIVSTTTRLNFVKTYLDNDKWCMFFDAGEKNISITCYGIGDQLTEITTTRYLATSTTSVLTTLETTSSSSSQKPYNLTTIINSNIRTSITNIHNT
ncbi:uncharacterized protein LOC128238813 [Mya arenaria]|uniref:uncharacterized protein LOC128238813 n=1 Tax=Mya arenaria TaxID=6604 RepID=UPI0022E495D2|nr:uncharacterized protein LOC128238813 [Mya arenaria]